MGNVRILAADSMGVRSLATVVETCGLVIGIDLGASLAPRRYGLPPHEIELKRLEYTLNLARQAITESDILIITHYHYDHYIRFEPELYYGKKLLVKHPKQEINASQRMRAWRFLVRDKVEDKANVAYADGREFRIGDVVIRFSQPVWHGDIGSRVGKVLMVKVTTCDGETLAYTSDVQGPADPAAIEFLEQEPRPGTIILGGPPTYFAGYKVPRESVEKGLRGLMTVIERLRPSVLVVDHHLLRDLNYTEAIREHLDRASQLGVRLLTAAEFMNKPIEPLEAMRRELWRGGSR